MKRLLSFLLILLLCVPAAMAESPIFYIDGGNADRVHLRAEPSLDADSMGLYYTGTDVIVISYEGDWAWVMVGDEDGYITREYLTLVYTNRSGPQYVVDNPNDTWVNLRMAPSMNGMVAMCPGNGTPVQVLGETASGWTYVECEGVKGYIMTRMLSEQQETTVQLLQTTILAELGVDSYIQSCNAPNGQVIYFASELRMPQVYLEDVNFDGFDDIVIMTMTSAKSSAFRFVIYDEYTDEYVHVPSQEYSGGYINYTLYPTVGIVQTHATNGDAGLLHVTNLYRWEGNNLKLIRSSVSDEWSEDIFEGSTYMNIIHGDILHVTVRDHSKPYDESVIWEIIIPKADTEYRDIFNEEMEALWQGLR